VGYNGRKTVPVWDTMEKIFCFVGYNRRKFVMKHSEMVLRCVPQRKKTFPIGSHIKTKFFSKIHSTHESGSQVEQFDVKKFRVKNLVVLSL
jgi:hypothetical protein